MDYKYSNNDILDDPFLFTDVLPNNIRTCEKPLHNKQIIDDYDDIDKRILLAERLEFPEKEKIFKNTKFRGMCDRQLTENEYIYGFYKIGNNVIKDSLYKKNASKSNKKSLNFYKGFLALLSNKKECVFEYNMRYIGRYSKNLDIIIYDDTKKNNEIDVISLVFPIQSIKKNKGNAYEHVDDAHHSLIYKNKNNLIVKKAGGFIMQPTETYNMSKNKYIKENIINTVKETLDIKDNCFIHECDETNTFGKKIDFKKYQIFYRPTEDFFNAIKTNNTDANTRYIIDFANPNDIIEFCFDFLA